MTRKKRRIFFYIFSTVFLLTAPFIIFYAVGRVPDLITFSFVKTGGIFVKSKTTGLRIFLNNEFQKNTSFISGGAILTNIKTGRYILKIEKDGYKSWYKSVDVLPEQVTELRNILILPEEINKEDLKPDMGNLISVSPDGLWFLTEKKGKSSKALFLFDVKNQEFHSIIQASKEPVSQAIWGKDAIIILHEGDIFSVIRTNQNPYIEEIISSSSVKSSIVSVDFYGDIEDSFAILGSDDKLYSLKNSITKKIRDNINSFGIYGNNLFFIDKNGFLAKLNIDSKEIKIIDRPGFFLSDKHIKIGFSEKGDLFLIDSSGGLFFVSNKEENIIHPVAGEVIGAEFDSLGKKLLFWTPNEIRIFWIEPNVYQPFQKEFATESIFKIDSGLKSAKWFTKDDSHIIITANSGIYLTEIDGRGGRNTIELYDKKTDKIFWDKNLNKLYFSSKDAVKSINF